MKEFASSWRRRAAGVGIGAALVVALVTPAASAEVKIVDAGGSTAIADSYVVVFKNGTVSAQGASALVDALAARAGAEVDFRYRSALRGFAGSMSEGAAKSLAADPAVAYVAQNHTVKATADQPNPPSWGLDRIDQRDRHPDKNYQYATTADNVNAYILDTGIRTTHTDFGGRATFDFNAVDGNNTDCNGHGTHVAGTVGGSAHGVAKAVKLHAVKVLDCAGSGTMAGAAAGVDWVTANAVKPAVANLSLGGGASTVLDDAVRASIASGITYAVASGNEGVDACATSPARVSEAITVNAVDNQDTKASFSNYGPCTDLFAPGVDITSTWNGSDTATNTISGTSMAAPHVTGAAALHLATNPGATPRQVRHEVVTILGTPNLVTNPGANSPDKQLFTGKPGNVLRRGESTSCLNSPRSTVMTQLTAQYDGNLVLSTYGRATWSTRTFTDIPGPKRLTMQSDGNLVLYTETNVPLWHTHTNGTGATTFILQGDSNLVLYGPDGEVYWHRWQ